MFGARHGDDAPRAVVGEGKEALKMTDNLSCVFLCGWIFTTMCLVGVAVNQENGRHERCEILEKTVEGDTRQQLLTDNYPTGALLDLSYAGDNTFATYFMEYRLLRFGENWQWRGDCLLKVHSEAHIG